MMTFDDVLDSLSLRLSVLDPSQVVLIFPDTLDEPALAEAAFIISNEIAYESIFLRDLLDHEHESAGLIDLSHAGEGDYTIAVISGPPGGRPRRHVASILIKRADLSLDLIWHVEGNTPLGVEV